MGLPSPFVWRHKLGCLMERGVRIRRERSEEVHSTAPSSLCSSYNLLRNEITKSRSGGVSEYLSNLCQGIHKNV